jgi:hypothetical protein
MVSTTKELRREDFLIPNRYTTVITLKLSLSSSGWACVTYKEGFFNRKRFYGHTSPIIQRLPFITSIPEAITRGIIYFEEKLSRNREEKKERFLLKKLIEDDCNTCLEEIKRLNSPGGSNDLEARASLT